MYIRRTGSTLADPPIPKPGDLLKDYFQILESFAGPAADVARESNATPGNVARDFVADAAARTTFAADVAPRIHKEITSFWTANRRAVHGMRGRLPGAKALFGGDIGSQLSDGLFNRAGLYFDTIIVHDPLMRLIQMPLPPEEQTFYLLKYGVTQLLLKEVYLADIWPPIALLVPDSTLTADSADGERMVKVAGFDFLLLLNRLFEKHFDTVDEAEAFFRSFSTAQDVFREAKHPDLLLFSSDAAPEPGAQLEALLRDSRRLLPAALLPTEPRSRDLEILHTAIHGRLRQAAHLMLVADADRASPILTAPLSFRWLSTKLELNREFATAALSAAGDVGLPKTNALLSEPLAWLANVSLEALVELRQTGQLSDLRKQFADALDGFSGARVDDLTAVARHVDHRLSEAIAAHQQKVKALDVALRSELRLAVPTLLGAVVATLQPGIATLLPDSLKGLAGLIGAANLKDIVKAISVHYRERKTLGRTPIGILWGARNTK
jgi:hypothetical protein